MNEQKSTEAPLRLELTGITKQFPGVLANDNVSFAVKPGQIHALLGENGAGKSTLVKMIYGIMAPDGGTIKWNGDEVHVANPRAARKLGVGMVFQHFSLFGAMTVLENIALGMDGGLSHRELEGRIRAVLDEYGLTLDPQRVVDTLSVGERQRIEIVRALLLDPSLLIMDEPTSVLTPQEVEQLFTTLRRLAANGCSILYISHKLHEIRDLCDEATILRGGKVVAHCDPRVETPKSMAELMIGADLKEAQKPANTSFGEVRLEVDELKIAAGEGFAVALRGVTFSVRAGEIFGIAGVAGNGQNELLLALAGEVSAPDNTAILIDGQAVGHSSAGHRRVQGLCAVPEERNGHAAVPDFSLSDNTILTARGRMGLTAGGIIRAGAARDYAGQIIDTFAVMTTGHGAVAESLSGGNLQKFIMGREIMQTPDVLVVCQPTWGVDAGAAAAIHQALVDLATKGSAIVLISQDLDELLALSDHMAVINEGHLSRTLKMGEVSIEEIGLLMGGVHGEADGGAAIKEVPHGVPA
jgi:general nucleoside transport system ATP-binding protein